MPSLYTRWIEAVLGAPPPDEPRTACGACAMLAPPGVEAAGNRIFFDPATKCCTFLPALPNFLVGRILADGDPVAPGRSSVVARLRAGVAVSPLGIARAPREAALHRAGLGAFGRAPSLRCPHYCPAGGTCGIWPHWPAVCATFFCRFARGMAGKRFWTEVRGMLRAVEHGLTEWCALELGVPPPAVELAAARWPLVQQDPQPLAAGDLEGRVDHEQYSAAWGDWRGREIEFYTACADRVAALEWNDIGEICGVELRHRSQVVRAAHRTLLSDTLPGRLRVGSLQTVNLSAQGATVVTYNPLDPLCISYRLLSLLACFDGRPTDVVVQELHEKEHVRISASLLRRLIDHGILLDAGAQGAGGLTVPAAAG